MPPPPSHPGAPQDESRSASDSRRTWRVRDLIQDYVVVRPSELAEEEADKVVPASHLVANLDRWLASVSTSRSLREMYEVVSGASMDRLLLRESVTREQLRRGLSDAFKNKVLVGVVTGAPRVKSGSGASAGQGAKGIDGPVPLLDTPPVVPVTNKTTKTTKAKEEPSNVVTPLIQAEYLVVLLDRKLAAHQDPKEAPVSADATCVQLSFTQTNSAYPPTKGATLKCTPDNVDVYLDEKCEDKLAGALTSEQLTPDRPLKVYLKGKTAGKFKLELSFNDPADPRIKLDKNPAGLEMGVVELEFKVHRSDATALAALQVDPDTDPITTYHTALENLVLPGQKEMSDEDKVKFGRLLHVQKGDDHGRARVLCKQLKADQWPAGTDDYKVVLNQTSTSGEVSFHKKEWGGSKVGKVELKVADLKAADTELWVEGNIATTDFRHVRLDLGLDRGSGGLEKKVKRNGDWARFTVVEIKQVKLEFTSDVGKAVFWDAAKKRFYINTDADPSGRELKSEPTKGRNIKVSAELTHKLKGVKLHFMLSPHKDNHEKAHWGASLPATFKFKDLDRALKAKDKANPKDFLHVSAVTDDTGSATQDDLVLSRFGGDRFKVGAYLDEDPHLARYLDGHATLSGKKPALSEEFQVWRRVWVQITRDKNSALVSRSSSKTAFARTFIEYKEAPEHTFDTATLGLATNPRWQFEPGGANTHIVCVGNHNKATFHGMFVPATDEISPKAHLVMVDAQWDPEQSQGFSFQTTTRVTRMNSPNSLVNNLPLGVFNPPLDAATIVDTGRWEWNDGANTHEGLLTDAEVTIEQARMDTSEFKVTLPGVCPATCPCGTPGTAVSPSVAKQATVELLLNTANGPWAGESGSPGHPQCLIVIDSNANQFNNTISHEIGHLHEAVRTAVGWHGLPDHPNQYVDRGGLGSHCKESAVEDATVQDQNGNNVYASGTCVMFHMAVGNVTFCDDCGADLRLRDLSDFFK
jgi:hypothetical protein